METLSVSGVLISGKLPVIQSIVANHQKCRAGMPHYNGILEVNFLRVEISPNVTHLVSPVVTLELQTNLQAQI
jgi:hypothetical protein